LIARCRRGFVRAGCTVTIREAERRIIRELTDLRKRQAASEAILIQIAGLVLYNLPDSAFAIAALKRESRFVVESNDQSDANTLRLMLDEHVARIADLIRRTIDLAN
jgi:hypothetical protein